MMLRETPGWARNGTANRLEILSPASSSGCVLASVQSPGCICHISLAAWGPSQGGPAASSAMQLSWLGDLGTRAGRGRTGPEKKQVMGTRGEELCRGPMQGSPRAPPTCATQGLPRDIPCPLGPSYGKRLFLQHHAPEWGP